MEKWWPVFVCVFFLKCILLERRVLGTTITFSKILEQLTGMLLSCILKVSPIHSVTILHWLPPTAFLMSSGLHSSLEKMQRWDTRGQCLLGLGSMN